MPSEVPSPILPLGVCVWSEAGINRPRSVSYPRYMFEILTHAGVFHTPLTPLQLLEKLDSLRVLVTVGDHELTDELKKRLTKWVEAGGAWISVAGTCGMHDLLGATPVTPTYANFGGGVRSLGEGYLAVEKSDHPIVGHVTRPLHYFGGAAVKAADGATVLARAQDAHGRATDQPVLIEREVGKGRTVFIAVDLPGTVVRIQQGH